MMTDPIADMLARIRNASMASLEHTDMPFSQLREHIAQILHKEGYINGLKVVDKFPKTISVKLKYGRNNQPAIMGLRRLSRPGKRRYVGCEDIPRVHNGMGIAILSTSAGVMSDQEARKKRVGGELLCEVW